MAWVSGLRVAIAPGRHALRVAVATAGGAPRVVAELPASTDPLAALAAHVGPGAREVLLVHGPDPPAPAGWTLVPAALAVAAGRAATVLDVGRSGATVTLVRDGAAAAARYRPIGGDRLDRAVVALLGPPATLDDARRVREELSLQSRAVHRGRPVTASELAAVVVPLLDELVALLASVADPALPVVLVGGVARSPLLAERIDAAGSLDPGLVEVVPRPDVAALLSALALPVRSSEPAAVPASPDPPVLPPPRRPAVRGTRSAALALVVGALAGTVTQLVVPHTARPSATAADAAGSVGVLVQYGYRVAVPPGWEQTGGLPERRRSLLTRIGTPAGTDLIAVESTPLGYDSGAEPDRARSELRAVYDEATAAGSTLSGYGPTHFGGRDVVTYRQREPSGADVDWYVVLDGPAQLSVGCRHTVAGRDAVRTACAVVVGSVSRV